MDIFTNKKEGKKDKIEKNLARNAQKHEQKGEQGKGLPPGLPSGFGGKGQIFSNIASTVLIFLIIATLYSTIVGNKAKIEEISVSQVAQDISGGLVKKISVEGEVVNAEYLDGTKKKSKKESEASFSQTLVNYGVSAEKLAKVNIEVKSESGFGYWVLNLLPFLLPLFLLFFCSGFCHDK